MRKNLFHIILAAFCLLPRVAFGDEGKCIEGDCLNGKGVYVYSNGEKYDGDFKSGEINGEGVYTYLDGSRYEGEFANGNRHGQGTLKIIDGITYVGQWANDLPNGQGVKTLVDGMQYSGKFKDGLMYGSGRIVMPDGNTLKIKWSNTSTLQKDGNQAVSGVESDKIKKDWYMTASPGKIRKSLGQGPQQPVKHIEVSTNDLTAEENPPSRELQSALIKDQVTPQASSVDEDPAEDKHQTEAISKSILPEKKKIKSETVGPVPKSEGPKPQKTFPPNSETSKAGSYASIAVGANIRSEASLTSDILRTVPSGYPVVVLEKKEDWYLVEDYRGRKGWVYASLVNEPNTVIIKVFKGNLRSGPSTKDDIIVQLEHGTIMSVLERNGKWLKVSDNNKVTGWLNYQVIWPVAQLND